MIKRIATMIGAGLIASQAIAGNWANIRPAYDPKQKHATVRVEGRVDIADRLAMYGIVDFDATAQRPLDLDAFSGKLRFNYALGDQGKKHSSLSVSAEYETNSGAEDKLRIGLIWTPRLAEGNFTQFRVYTGTTHGMDDAQAIVYTSQTFGDRFTPNLLVLYNLESHSVYSEPELDVKATKKLEFMLQGRVFGTPGKKTDVRPIVGIKYSF